MLPKTPWFIILRKLLTRQYRYKIRLFQERMTCKRNESIPPSKLQTDTHSWTRDKASSAHLLWIWKYLMLSITVSYNFCSPCIRHQGLQTGGPVPVWGAQLLQLLHRVHGLPLLVPLLCLLLRDGNAQHRLELSQALNTIKLSSRTNHHCILNQPDDIIDSQNVFFLLTKNMPPFETSRCSFCSFGPFWRGERLLLLDLEPPPDPCLVERLLRLRCLIPKNRFSVQYMCIVTTLTWVSLAPPWRWCSSSEQSWPSWSLSSPAPPCCHPDWGIAGRPLKPPFLGQFLSEAFAAILMTFEMKTNQSQCSL